MKSRENIRHRIVMLYAPSLYYLPLQALITDILVSAWIYRGKLLVNGASVFTGNVWLASEINQDGGVQIFFPPEIVVEIKALACEMPSELGLPFSRLSHSDIAREAVKRGIVASISGATVWRWLSEDAIKPWSWRSWIFPRDPLFAEKAAPVLNLYQGFWMGEALGPKDYVISADEKTSIQARSRCTKGSPALPHQSRRVEFEYERKGALAYLAAWDVQHAKLFGLLEPATGIESYKKLVNLVMRQEPYRSANRVFWITDNGSSHRGENSIERLSLWYPNAVQIHTPIHASWLNQIEIYFSVVQRKVLTPNDFSSLDELGDRLLQFQTHYEKIAKPFEWKFTIEDLKNILNRLSKNELEQKLTAA